MRSVRDYVDCSYLTGENDAPKQPHVQRNRCYPFIVIVNVLEGGYYAAHASAGPELAIGPGETLVVPERLPHVIAMREAGRLTWAHLCCHIGGRDILSGLTEPGIVRGDAAAQLTDLCSRLNAIAEAPSSQQAMLLEHSVISHIGAVLSETFPSVVNAVSDAVRQAMETIESRLAEELPLREIAADVGLSVSALERKFREETYLSPLKFQRECRIRRAVELLLSGNRVSETAYLVGYADPYYFSRLFRQGVGVSPAQYQRQFRRSNPLRD